ncbi:hypothetical protein E2C01_007173 [Portunus trituberculatus]|uniref:Uncharacterized protein n=1 Tax=Portunus trituberculatus TaxID=210409 RepID=A0A5B7CYR3_PORTR|nr:hypothetical protein [Portunus trituberculatus]
MGENISTKDSRVEHQGRTQNTHWQEAQTQILVWPGPAPHLVNDGVLRQHRLPNVFRVVLHKAVVHHKAVLALLTLTHTTQQNKLGSDTIHFLLLGWRVAGTLHKVIIFIIKLTPHLLRHGPPHWSRHTRTDGAGSAASRGVPTRGSLLGSVLLALTSPHGGVTHTTGGGTAILPGYGRKLPDSRQSRSELLEQALGDKLRS